MRLLSLSAAMSRPSLPLLRYVSLLRGCVMTTQGTAESFRVFVRNWWRWESAYGVPDARYPNVPRTLIGRHLVPDPGARKTTLATRCAEQEAQTLAKRYNAEHKPGPLSRKAEYESE